MVYICSEHVSQRAMCWNFGPQCGCVDILGSLRSTAHWKATVAGGTPEG